MEGGPVDELLCVTVERPVLDQLQIEVGGTLEYRVDPGPTGDDREDRHLHEVDKARSHQRSIHRQAAVRAQRLVGLLLEPGDDVDCVPADELRVRPVERLLQRGRHHRGRRVPHPRDPRIAHVVPFSARGQHPRELPVGGSPENHALVGAVQVEAMVEQLRALLAPVPGPVGAGGGVAIEAGEDVERISGGHGIPSVCDRCTSDRDHDGNSSPIEQPAIPADLDVCLHPSQDRPEQDLVGLEHGTSQALLQRPDPPAARKPVPPMKTASASSLTWRQTHSMTAPGSMRPGSFASPADSEETTWKPCRRKYAAPRWLSSSSNHGGWTNATRPTSRARNAAPAECDVPATGTPQRSDSRSSMAASASKPMA